MTDTKQAPYVVVIDMQRQQVLTALFNLAYIEHERLFTHLTREGLHDVFLDFIDECSAHQHDRDWCEDTECTYKKD